VKIGYNVIKHNHIIFKADMEITQVFVRYLRRFNRIIASKCKMFKALWWVKISCIEVTVLTP